MHSNSNHSRVDRLVRRLDLEEYGKCSHCSPHRGENAKHRTHGSRPSKARK